MKIQATKIFELNWQALNSGKYKYIVNSGSSRSSKTFSIIQIFWLIAWTKPRTKLAVFRNTKKDCKDTILQDMLKYYPTLSGWGSVVYNKTESVLTFPNGSAIYIEGSDDDIKVHGYHSDYLWFNEMYRVPLEVFNQLDMRCTTTVFLDYNPIGRLWSDELIKQDNCIVIHSTFKDNPFIPLEQKKKILSYQPTEYNIQQGTANEYMWQVYGLGLKAEKPNKIYRNWKELDKAFDFDQLPYPSYYGLDFGSRNPTALVEVKYDGERTFFVKQRLYKPLDEMGVQLHEVLTGIIKDKRIPIVCDYADPNAISDLRVNGFNAIPCTPKNVNNRINFIQSMQVQVANDSEDIWNEYESYEWEVVSGVNLDRPIKKDDHLMDAFGYICEYLKIYLHIK
jgi:PBSX family phage terminase large subunit